MDRLSEHLRHEGAFRGDDLVARRENFPLVLMGCGAVGSWLLDLLARQGYRSITVIDRDRVDADNFGTQNFGARDRGRMKSTIAANNLFLRLGFRPASIDREVTADNVARLVKGAGLVIDMFDNAESRLLVQNSCVKHNVNCIHAGMSHDGFAEIEWNEVYKVRPAPVMVDDEGVPCHYPLASNLVSLTVTLLAEAVNAFVDGGVKNAIHATLRDLHVDVYRR